MLTPSDAQLLVEGVGLFGLLDARWNADNLTPARSRPAVSLPIRPELMADQVVLPPVVGSIFSGDELSRTVRVSPPRLISPGSTRAQTPRPTSFGQAHIFNDSVRFRAAELSVPFDPPCRGAAELMP